MIPRQTKPFTLYTESPIGEFICINDFLTSRATTGHKTIRSNDNVELRNYLIESDTSDLDSQIQKATINRDRGYPYKEMTFSGSKSIHLIYEVQLMAQTLDEYRYVRQYLLEVLQYDKDDISADPNTKDPARLTRRPNVYRSNGIQQLSLDTSIGATLQLDWRKSYDFWLKLKTIAPLMTYTAGTDSRQFVKNYMKKHDLSIIKGERNHLAIKLIGAMRKAGFQSDQIQDALTNIGLQDKIQETINLINFK